MLVLKKVTGMIFHFFEQVSFCKRCRLDSWMFQIIRISLLLQTNCKSILRNVFEYVSTIVYFISCLKTSLYNSKCFFWKLQKKDQIRVLSSTVCQSLPIYHLSWPSHNQKSYFWAMIKSKYRSPLAWQWVIKKKVSVYGLMILLLWGSNPKKAEFSG